MCGATARNQGTKVCGKTDRGSSVGGVISCPALCRTGSNPYGMNPRLSRYCADNRRLVNSPTRPPAPAPRPPAAPRPPRPERTDRPERGPRAAPPTRCRPSPSPNRCRSRAGARTSRAPSREHQVVIVCGETGSGKTTQLPKIVLELGRGRANGGGLIGHTQPRRIAASSVAKRIAEELNSPLGEVVGYKVRFQDRCPAAAPRSS